MATELALKFRGFFSELYTIVREKLVIDLPSFCVRSISAPITLPEVRILSKPI